MFIITTAVCFLPSVFGVVYRETDEGALEIDRGYAEFTCFNRPMVRGMPTREVCQETRNPRFEELLACSMEFLHTLCMDLKTAAKIFETYSVDKTSLPRIFDLGVINRRHLSIDQNHGWGVRMQLCKSFLPRTVEDILESFVHSHSYVEISSPRNVSSRNVSSTDPKLEEPRYFVPVSFLLNHFGDVDTEMDKPIVYRQDNPLYGQIVAHQGHNMIVVRDRRD